MRGHLPPYLLRKAFRESDRTLIKGYVSISAMRHPVVGVLISLQYSVKYLSGEGGRRPPLTRKGPAAGRTSFRPSRAMAAGSKKTWL